MHLSTPVFVCSCVLKICIFVSYILEMCMWHIVPMNLKKIDVEVIFFSAVSLSTVPILSNQLLSLCVFTYILKMCMWHSYGHKWNIKKKCVEHRYCSKSFIVTNKRNVCMLVHLSVWHYNYNNSKFTACQLCVLWGHSCRSNIPIFIISFPLLIPSDTSLSIYIYRCRILTFQLLLLLNLIWLVDLVELLISSIHCSGLMMKPKCASICIFLSFHATLCQIIWHFKR